MAHPIIWTDEKKAELLEKLEKYIDETNVPILTEFCSQNKVNRQRVYEWEEFSDMIAICVQKKEYMLEKLALANKINVSMAIFSLKQLGWSDKKSCEHSGPGGVGLFDNIKIVFEGTDDVDKPDAEST